MMRFATIRRASVLTATIATFAALLAAAPASAAEAFKIDGVHSSVVFRVKHLDVSYVFGRFNQVGGEFALDDAKPEGSSLSVEVKAASIDTAAAKRDDHLRGPDFFNAKQFPTIKFVGKQFKKSAEGWDVTGDLTLHGVTKSIAVKIEVVGKGKDPFGAGQRSGIAATFDIKRSDYGMSFMTDKLGDEVKLMVSLEGVAG